MMLDFRKPEDRSRFENAVCRVLDETRWVQPGSKLEWTDGDDYTHLEYAGWCFTQDFSANTFTLEIWDSIPATRWEPEGGDYLNVKSHLKTPQALLDAFIVALYDVIKTNALEQFQCSFHTYDEEEGF